MLYVADQADDFTHLLAGIVSGKTRLNSFADHILPGKKLSCETFIHDHNRRRVELVRLIEAATLPERNCHGLEIVGADDSNWGAGTLPFRKRMLFAVEIRHHIAAAKGQRLDRADR